MIFTWMIGEDKNIIKGKKKESNKGGPDETSGWGFGWKDEFQSFLTHMEKYST